MGRISRIPTQYDDLKTIDISVIRKWGYLKPDTVNSFSIKWSRDGVKTASVGCLINMRELYFELDYMCNGVSSNYRVKLVAMPSNLGKGYHYYFLCPVALKACRKLYLYNGRFVHRSIIDGYYFIQLVKPRDRGMIKMCRRQFQRERYLDESFNKYYKRFYRGKPTKRYAKLIYFD